VPRSPGAGPRHILGALSSGRLASGRMACRRRKREIEDLRRIKETRVTCEACGNVWHYGKADELESANAALQNASKALLCCTGCLPAMLMPDKKVVDLSKCPKCGSRAVRKETVEHEVP
jgi:predicted nucleic-acid-binding Zn-ribbon protein